jgi:hypothetical protein
MSTPDAAQRAVAAARAVAQAESTIPVTLISVKSGRFGDLAPDVFVSPPQRKVWAITFHGKVFGSCGAAMIRGTPRACGPASAVQTVVLDYQTDAFITGETYGIGG